jgi:hypothetical protein
VTKLFQSVVDEFLPLVTGFKKKYLNLCKSFKYKTLKYFKWKKTTRKKRGRLSL